MKNRRLALLLAALLAVCTFAVLAPAAFAGAAAREPAWGSEGHGLVEFDKAEYLPGETVTVTVTPDSGYCLAIISVNDGTVAMTKTGEKLHYLSTGNNLLIQ